MDYIKNRIFFCLGFAGIAFIAGIASLFILEDKLFAVVPFAVSGYLVISALQFRKTSQKKDLKEFVGLCKDKQPIKVMLQKSEESHFVCEGETGTPFDLFVTATPKVVDSKNKSLVIGVRYRLVYFGVDGVLEENPIAIIRQEGNADV